MKFLLVPNTESHYDVRLLRLFANSIDKLGHSTGVLDLPISSHHDDFSSSNLRLLRRRLHMPHISSKQLYKEISADCILEVNRFRSKHLKDSVRHISWFQDIRPTDFLKIGEYVQNMRGADLIYLLGDQKHFGMKESDPRIKCLLTGLTQTQINNNQSETICKYDVNLLGYLSQIQERLDINLSCSRAKIILSELIRAPRSIYKLLFREESDFNLDKFQYDKTYALFRNEVLSNYKPLQGEMFPPPIEKMNGNINKRIINRLYTELPRKLDRMILFEKVHELHQRGKNVFVAGKNWPNEFHWASFAHPHVANPVDIYENSAVTVHNNTHGLGIHSRVLEAMAAGSFVIMHPSPHSRLPGGMDSTFEPDVNYGLYSADNFVDQVEEWLADEDRRKKAIAESKKILLSKHLWKHRAEQILGDLR